MYGCTRAEYDQGIAQGKPLFTLDDMASAVERLGGAASLSGDYDVQVRTRRIDGAPFDVRVQARVIPGACGMAEMYVVLSDVTEEVREQRKRAWQNERYRLLSELTHAISFDYDSESDTVLLYLDRTGKGMEEQVITHYLENLSANRAGVVHPGSLATVRGMFERVNAGEAGVEIEYRADYHGNGYQWYRRQPVRRERRRGRMASGGAHREHPERTRAAHAGRAGQRDGAQQPCSRQKRHHAGAR